MGIKKKWVKGETKFKETHRMEIFFYYYYCENMKYGTERVMSYETNKRSI